VVTGKGLAGPIREKFGVKTTFYLMMGLLIANLANTIGEFAGVAAAGEVFGISKYISVPLSALLVWLLVVKGNYKTVEKVFLTACVFYVAYIISGVMESPPWAEVLQISITPSFSFQPSYITMVIGVVGTTIAPWMQFYLQSSIVEKGLAVKDYKYSRLDVVVGCFATDIVAWFIIVACAATLFQHHIQIETAKDAAIALRPPYQPPFHSFFYQCDLPFTYAKININPLHPFAENAKGKSLTLLGLRSVMEMGQ